MRRWWKRAAEPGAGEARALAALRERARALPREVEPARDLWAGVRHRIASAPEPARPGLWRTRLQVPVWAVGAATALLVATTVGSAVWLGRAPSLADPSAVRELADTLRQRDGMSGTRRDLLLLLDGRRGQLPPEVVSAVEKNLAEIDRAIAEIHLAFEAHPGNAELRFLLAEAYRREAEMLEQLEWWTGAGAREARS